MESTFQNVLLDVAGRLKIESEDPRWSALFRTKDIFCLRGDEDEFETFCSRLSINAHATGNLSQLFEHAASKIDFCMMKRTKPTPLIIEQCCASLHLCGLILNYFASSLLPHEVNL
jgi:hypothetical protein